MLAVGDHVELIGITDDACEMGMVLYTPGGFFYIVRRTEENR